MRLVFSVERALAYGNDLAKSDDSRQRRNNAVNSILDV